MRNYLAIISFCVLTACNSGDRSAALKDTIAAQQRTIDNLKGQEKKERGTESSETVSSGETGKLYEKIGITESKNIEFAEVLSIAQADTSFNDLNDYKVRVYLACNGAPDLNIDGCNCTHYAYVTTSTYDMPYDYSLFKVGPFYLPKFVKWEGTREEARLTIQHEIKGKPAFTVIKTNGFAKVTVDDKI